MSEYKIGDKVYLECEVIKRDMSDNTYQLKYRSWHGGKKSTDYVNDGVLHTPDDAYNKGLNDAWALMKKIVKSPINGGYKANELAEIFGISDKPILDAYTPQEALAKVREYEERNEIKVGDVVRLKGSVIEGIVTRVDSRVYQLFRDGSCNIRIDRKDFVKTGKHFDSIDEFMRSEE